MKNRNCKLQLVWREGCGMHSCQCFNLYTQLGQRALVPTCQPVTIHCLSSSVYRDLLVGFDVTGMYGRSELSMVG